MMKAPKVLLALGLAVPILVQGLSHHHEHAHPDEHDLDDPAARVHGCGEWHTSLPRRSVIDIFTDVHHEHDNDQSWPPWIPHFKPSRKPPQVADMLDEAGESTILSMTK